MTLDKKKHKMRSVALLLLLCFSFPSLPAQVQYTSQDSIRVTQMLKEACTLKKDTNLMLYFGRQLIGIPYVAKTLEGNPKEKLVVNLRQLDCTTLVENTLALTLCARNTKTQFADFLTFLRLVRYRNGEVSYLSRLHYFTEWIIDNVRMGYIEEISTPAPPFTGIQKISLNFMSTHASQYPMLVQNPSWISDIRNMEQELQGMEFSYIPKEEIANTSQLRSVIHDGDIIAILTSRPGLDISHVGIAVWHTDGLHLLNASQIHKKVVEEPMTLSTYMKRHPSQIGIRIVRVSWP